MADVLAAIALVAINFIPSILLSYAAFKNTFLDKWDKLFMGLVLAVLVPPTLFFLEFLFLGLGFSFMLVLANALLVLLLSVAVLHVQNQKLGLGDFKPDLGKGLKELVSKNYVGIILLLLLSASFFIRFATATSPTFFEFDPYFYDKITEKIVLDGSMPAFSPEVYYPNELFIRVPPLMHYLQASWYSTYASIAGLAYSKEMLIFFSQMVPPLAGALLAFLAFLLLREEYNQHVGLVIAGVFAFLPQLIKKFGAGVSEQQPFGLFTVLLVFALYILAVGKKSNRLSLLAGFAMAAVVLSSQQYIWPFMVITVYIAFQSVLDYVSGTLDDHFVKTNAILVAGALIASLLFSIYTGGERFSFLNTNQILLLASLLFSIALWAAGKFLPSNSSMQRLQYFAGIVFVLAVVVIASSFWVTIANVVQGQLGSAFARGALGKTIQEEGSTSPAFFQPSFGVLNPPLLLLLTALLASVVAILSLFSKGHRNYAIVFAVVAGLLLFLNNQVDFVLKFVAKTLGFKPLVDFIDFFASNDVFIYLLAGIIATAIYYLYSAHKSRTSLLFMLIFFPVAYIGLNKVKFLLHLGLAVALSFGFVLGESLRAFEMLGKIFNLANFEKISKYALALVLLVGIGVVFTEAQMVPESMDELKFTRIPADWVLFSELSPAFSGTPVSAMGWLYHNTNRLDPAIQQACREKHGWDCRVLSWWDYGHWITFFGDSNSVLDPNNLYPWYDQEVARAFVNGNPEDMDYTMRFHRGTHVLVDSDLIGKWGALVFLSGTCSKEQSPTCPETPEINWQSGSGQSQYEAEHHYEYLTVQSETCPNFASAVPLPMLKSSFGAVYCADNEFLYVLTQDGLLPSYKRKFIITNAPNTVEQLDESVSYLLPISQGTFLNLNPDLSFGNINNTVFRSAFTRLFFFEKLPGFKLAFRSPNGAVKIFEYLGPGVVEPTPTPSPSPEVSPSPSVFPSASPSPGKEGNSS
ncbi:MAG: STT3 domain-containing protein [Candidatus Norongarragalinales archaeon]